MSGHFEKAREQLIAALVFISPEAIESDYGFRRSAFLSHLEANELQLAIEELDGAIEDNPSQANSSGCI